MDTSGSQETFAGTTSRSNPGRQDQATLRNAEAMNAKLAPAVADGYNNLGAIAATDSDYASAVIYFERASEWNPSLEGLDYNWGRAAFAGSRYGDAILPLSRYLKSHPDDSGARSVLSLSQFLSGKYRDCVETLQPIEKTELAPQVEYAYASSLVEIGQVGAGTERLLALERAHSDIPDVHRALAEAFDQQGDRKRALEEIHTAIELNPQDSGSHYDLGKIEMADGNSEGAIPELEAAVRLSPKSKDFHHELANAYTAAHRSADARKEMEIYSSLGGEANSGQPPSRTNKQP
jgi:tetratricopeptide (TPR) repeat protein